MQRIIALFIFSLAIFSCEQPTETIIKEVQEQTPDKPDNHAPYILQYTESVSAYEGDPATLSATAIDIDHDKLTYTWAPSWEDEKETGSTVELSPPAVAEYTVSLTVSDGDLTDSRESKIVVSPRPWEPDPMTLYILDADGGVYLFEVVLEADRWLPRLQAFTLTVDRYNTERIKPGPYPYRFVSGEKP